MESFQQLWPEIVCSEPLPFSCIGLMAANRLDFGLRARAGYIKSLLVVVSMCLDPEYRSEPRRLRLPFVPLCD